MGGRKRPGAVELLQRWLPLAQGKEGCPLLPVFSLFRQTHLDAVSFLSHSHIECGSFSRLATKPPDQPFLPDTPRLSSDAASGNGSNHGPSLPTRNTYEGGR